MNATAIRDVSIITDDFILIAKNGRLVRVEMDYGTCENVGHCLSEAWIHCHDLNYMSGNDVYPKMIKKLEKNGVTIDEIKADLRADCISPSGLYNITGGFVKWEDKDIPWLREFYGLDEDEDEIRAKFPNLSETILNECLKDADYDFRNLFEEWRADNMEDIEKMTVEELAKCKTLKELDGMFKTLNDRFDGLLHKTVQKSEIKAVQEYANILLKSARSAQPPMEAS